MTGFMVEADTADTAETEVGQTLDERIRMLTRFDLHLVLGKRLPSGSQSQVDNSFDNSFDNIGY
jgi:hypothetical protein